MLTTDQLLTVLADHESDAVEFTTSTKNTDKFCEAICAFANDFPNRRQPGYLLVGVNDDGTANGLTSPIDFCAGSPTCDRTSTSNRCRQ